MRIKNMIKLNSLDILTASLHYFCKKQQQRRMCNLILGVKRLKNGEDLDSDSNKTNLTLGCLFIFCFCMIVNCLMSTMA